MPAPALFVGSGLAQYLGAAIAVTLFATIPAVGVAWLRILFAAVVLVAWRRPWRLAWTRRDVGVVLAFGVALAVMNVFFYVAIDRLPLGTAVAIEFVGPVAVAAATGSGWRERGGVVVAAAGVLLLTGVSLVNGQDAVAGLVAIGVAATAWAAYILLGRRVALSGDGVTRLAAAMAVAAVLLAPVLARQATGVLDAWWLVGAVLGVAVLSSVIPYAIEQVVLRRVSAATFAVLLALLPATAAVVGAVVLRQWPQPLDVVGLVLVSAAIGLATTRRPEPVTAPDAGA